MEIAPSSIPESPQEPSRSIPDIPQISPHKAPGSLHGPYRSLFQNPSGASQDFKSLTEFAQESLKAVLKTSQTPHRCPPETSGLCEGTLGSNPEDTQVYLGSVSVVFQIPFGAPQVARQVARGLFDATMECPMRPSKASQVLQMSLRYPSGVYRGAPRMSLGTPKNPQSPQRSLRQVSQWFRWCPTVVSMRSPRDHSGLSQLSPRCV